MTSDDGRVTLPTVRLRNHQFGVRIDTGELLFPVVVLVFCAAYYVQTRGLPAESMLYAGPLLYATAILAVVTIFGHAVSIDTDGDGDHGQPSSESARAVVWGAKSAVAEQEHPREDGASKEIEKSETDTAVEDTSNFGVRSAIGLVVLSTGYISSLYVAPFVIGTVVFLAATGYVFGERDYLRIVSYSAGLTLVLWLVFVNWLQVPLP